ncbi:MAG: DUF1614 domain-containing protein [bacterium]|nr:DUF1614 domain-containing protein [bacterium]MDZ4231948.1 DUF1614 domain-containing protein [Candidatus Pacearchaeota archaeon]
MFLLPLSFLVFLLVLPALAFLGFFHIVTIGFENLGISPEVVVLILLLMLVGSAFNIPLGRKRLIEVETSSWFGLRKRRGVQAQGLSLNVGGGAIPILIASYLFLSVPAGPAMAAVLITALVSFKMSRVVPGRGVTIPILLPPLVAGAASYLLVPGAVPQAAFISGVFGVLIGADLLRLPFILAHERGMLSIGGAGVFDGIFLTSILAVLLTAL